MIAESRKAWLAAAAACLMLAAPACVARRRVITRVKGAQPARLQVATKAQLQQRVSAVYGAVQSFSATMDMTPAIGSADKGNITEYKDVRAFVLFQRPERIRLVGLYPVVRNKAFDMVSDGSAFQLYLPGRNRFVTGPAKLQEKSANRIENLRPQHFLEALLIPPYDAGREIWLLENFTDEDNAAYIIHVLERSPSGEPRLARDIWFDRNSLAIIRQKIFDERGDILSDARYSDWRPDNGVSFPRHIEINRPQDEYGVVMNLTKLEMNKTLAAAQFVLERPEGAELKVLGGAAAGARVK